ncbi:glycosyltransferase [Rhodospira trueperi]|uniref:Glycosyltransferase involved in cell wall bisynthesis n=1 Tax=Rhodospira trueperi TaxID=69960 RepID=A0A1G7BY38_9PROT|nr:glycosyltransferase [Rhodospira trueperi]SDE31932.1 Glycosyltransferase involved in cell wall bisynthesis [Rhodospira trueperi]
MKIAMLIASLGGGGAERIVLSLSGGLQALGHDVTVIACDQETVIAPPEGVAVEYLSRVSVAGATWKKILAGPVVAVRLWRLVRRHRYDVVVAHMERANVYVALVPMSAVKVMTVHNYLSASLPNKTAVKRLAATLLYRHLAPRTVGHVVCVSQVSADDVAQRCPPLRDRLAVIPNSVDVSSLENASREPIPEGAAHAFVAGKTIITVGRLVRQKGHWHLIRAFAESGVREDGRLIILGDGPMRAELERYAADLGVADQVMFVGFQGNPFSWIRRADLFVLPSLYEGMPMVLLEALACGTPIISADCKSGPREILAPGSRLDSVAEDIEVGESAVMVPPVGETWSSPDGPPLAAERMMTAAIDRILEDGALAERLISAARRRADYFDGATGAGRWDDFLCAALATSKRRGQ